MKSASQHEQTPRINKTTIENPICFASPELTTRLLNIKMPGQKLYPRATVKKIVKAHSNCSVSKNADVMVPIPGPDASPGNKPTDIGPDVLGLHALYANVREKVICQAINAQS